jgi:DNA recombination protein RmuC
MDAAAQASPLVLPVTLVLVLALIVALILVALRGRSGRGTVLHRLEQRLGEIDALSRNLNDLSRVLLRPHARGGFGETVLNTLLANWLPRRHYELQYGYRSGARVDAVVHLGDRLVPIDAKFPLEVLQRQVEQTELSARLSGEAKRAIVRMIHDIAEKYIHPEEGTFGFALMYVPSEAVFYHAFIGAAGADELFEAALREHVVPVGPSSLFLYLQTIAYGLKGLILSADQERLIRLVEEIQRETAELSRTLGTAGGHLRNAGRAYQDASGRMDRLQGLAERLDRLEK